MAIELITNWEGLSRIEAAWNALAGDSLFRTWDWLATWWKHYGDSANRHQQSGGSSSRSTERQLHVLAVYRETTHHRNGGGEVRELIGIAPWYLDRTVVKGNVLRWLGSGEVCTDYLSLICRPGDQDEVAAAAAEALTADCDEWDRLELNAIDADDTAVARLVAALEERGCISSRHAADSCWALDLPATWDDYLASLSKSHRKQLRRLEREVLESGRTVWHPVKTAAELPRGWEVLVDLHQRRRRSLGEAGCFASRLFHDYHREIAERLLASDRLLMSWLELDGAPAAAEYHFTDGTTTFAYQGGVDPDRLAEEPGRLSTILCLQAAIAAGHRRFDFLRGDEPYKAHWRAVPQPTFDYRVMPNRRLARLRGRILVWTDSVADWIRSAAPQPSN